ncbi:MAG: class I SAM-dependent methyltransferase [Spirochaetaceae bacterium]|jgi:SAM-dependent methyltransferase|nr:class I SAM-dependent methyltransferase [Spirochaetaceae bacterium]
MLLDRNVTLIANYILDNLIPPVLRDCAWFMRPFMKIAYGDKTKYLLDFKEKFPFMSDEELAQYYRAIVAVPINSNRYTDCNKQCLQWIVQNVQDYYAINAGGGHILDAACGRGYLLNKILDASPAVVCTGVDIAPSASSVPFEIRQADITALPFCDDSFDVVICTHALEHIREPHKALAELIRVTRKRLIIVVPRQREYRYTVDLHINFFPYMYSFKRFIGIKDALYLDLKGDLLCCVDF